MFTYLRRGRSVVRGVIGVVVRTRLEIEFIVFVAVRR